VSSSLRCSACTPEWPVGDRQPCSAAVRFAVLWGTPRSGQSRPRCQSAEARWRPAPCCRLPRTKNCCHNFDMPTWLAALLPVFSALLGVLVANRGSAQRDTVSRLWEQRVKTYIEIMNWTLAIVRELKLEDAANTEKFPPEVYQRLRMPDELVVRLMAFASDSVRRSYETCNAAISVLGSETPPSFEVVRVTTADTIRMLEQGLGSLMTAIRGELSTGSLRLPFHVRRSLRRYSASVD
jgi:hypothetical protein